jgi:hypothetical protein
MKTLASGRLDSPCGRIGGGFAAVRQAKLAANAPKREFYATFVGGHKCVLKNFLRLKFSLRTGLFFKTREFGRI